MDALVFVGRGAAETWEVYERGASKRQLGVIRRADSALMVIPVEGSPLEGVSPGPYETLDAALASIGRHLGGTCETWTP